MCSGNPRSGSTGEILVKEDFTALHSGTTSSSAVTSCNCLLSLHPPCWGERQEGGSTFARALRMTKISSRIRMRAISGILSDYCNCITFTREQLHPSRPSETSCRCSHGKYRCAISFVAPTFMSLAGCRGGVRLLMDVGRRERRRCVCPWRGWRRGGA